MSAKYSATYPNLALMNRFPVKIINTKYLFTMVALQFSNHQNPDMISQSHCFVKNLGECPERRYTNGI